MLSQRLNHFLVCSGCDKIISPYAQHRCTVHVKTVNIFPLAEHTRKLVLRMLSVRWNGFLVCSVWDKIVSAFAQHAHAIIFKNYSKSQIKMQISTIKIKILKNRWGTHLIGSMWTFWKKNLFGYLSKKIWFRVCSVTAKMFELRNSGEIRRKRSEMFFENLPRA